MSENPQLAHYSSIHDQYGAHYYDPYALNYRERFFFDRAFKSFDLNGKRIADIASGSGHNSLALKNRYPSARFEGFDISPRACEDYRRLLHSEAHQVDMTIPFQVEELFDAAIVIGGLHHCVANLPVAIDNLTNLLRPGGLLFFWEPNADFFLQKLRDYWYRKDSYFDYETERALTVFELKALARDRFSSELEFYFGGPAYFGILNSLIFRVPLIAKRFIAPPLFAAEMAWNKLPGKEAHATFAGAWRRI